MTASGKALGGIARAKKLTPQQRKEISEKGLRKRAENAKLPKAVYGSIKNPLKIGGTEIPCYVLSDGRRVLVQRGMASAIGISSASGVALSTFSKGKILGKFLSQEVMTALSNPIKFKTTNGVIAHGYEAKILADLCDVVLEARKQKKLLPSQDHIADQCEILVRGFARVGIIALVDEVTGYQEDRKRDALAQILEKFIAEELQPWIKTFPLDYYKELFRLRGLTFSEFEKKGKNYPQYFGTLTNNIVYSRLAPNILDEIKKKIPTTKSNNRVARYHQKLTPDTGHPRLREHLSAAIALMKVSSDYDDFISKLDKTHPKFSDI